MLWRLYERYDRVREPWRFLLFLACCAPLSVMMGGAFGLAPALAALAAIFFLIVTRWWYLDVRPRRHKRGP